MSVHPLIRYNSDGESYHRSATVTRPIEAALNLSPADLIERVALGDPA